MISNKKIKIIITTLFFIAVGIFTTNGVICYATNATIVNIDTPTINYSTAISSTKLNIKGWALSDAGVKQVQILVDDNVVGNAHIGESRPDVANVFPSYSNGSTSGYSYQLDVSQLSAGNHKLTVLTMGNNGTTAYAYRNFSTYNEVAMTCVDTPTQSSTCNNNQIQIAGWALNPSGVKSVQIYCDNNLAGQAQINMPRPDVQNVYNGYSGASTSGYSYTLDASHIGGGTHTITVKAIGNDGTSSLGSTKITRPGNMMCIDSPVDLQNVNNTANNTVTVSGWALNVSGIKEVDILVDGQGVGTATIGISRPDVNKAFPIYNNTTSGYSYTLDVSHIGGGTHTITVNAIGNDTTCTSQSTRITRPGNMMYIDSPVDLQKVNNTANNTVKVSGWALNASGIKEVDILVDGQSVGTATIGISRPDVANAFPIYNNTTSGYSYTLDVSHIGGGTHTITVNAIGNDTTSTSQSTRITRPDNMMCIDSPADLQKVNNTDSNTVTVSGWALNASGIKEVDILVDGQSVGTATIGISRPDVANAFPIYNNITSGYSYTLDVSHIGGGTHTITVNAIGNDTTCSSGTTRITRPGNMMSIDSPVDLQNVSSTVTVSGWALNASGIKEVDILVDGKRFGAATIGISRLDVNNAFPIYNNTTSGYSYTLDASQLDKGPHTITVQAIGNDTTSTSQSTRITRLDSMMYIDSPGNFQNVNSNVTVSGWALDASGIKEVDILVDGQSVGTATIGISRPDVANAFPIYNNTTSGYSYTLDVSHIGGGTHTITVNAIGNSGQTISQRVLVSLGSMTIYKGADVYEGNDISDYQLFKDSGIQVVIQKATQGETFTDSLLHYRETNLTKYGFLIGYYHYANNDSQPAAQAQHFLDSISGLHSDTVLWLDIEDEGSWTKQQAVAFTKEFISYVQARGYKIGIYSGMYFYNDYLADSNFNVPLWIASYGKQPALYPSVSWQYTETGTLSGVNSYIDLDYFNNSIFN